MTDHDRQAELSHFDYALDPALIALEPKPVRDQSRLLVYHRKRQTIEHRDFRAIAEYLEPKDLLVFNDTRVFPARLFGMKKGGGQIELLCLHPILRGENKTAHASPFWEVLVKGKSAPPVELVFSGGVTGTITHNLKDGRKELMFYLPGNRYRDVFDFLEQWGEVPLPPYITKKRDSTRRVQENDPERYQTVYAEKWGSAAAPTAGLHFTPDLIDQIKARGTQTTAVTLHIGLDTFLPIRTDTILEHKMHSEWFQVPEATAEKINQTRQKKGKVVAVGTTVARAIESAVQPSGLVRKIEGNTDIFIKPGYAFNGIDALITNFHLPKSTLLVMIAAFAGLDPVKRIYEEAIQHRYRFYSYGDAMLLL